MFDIWMNHRGRFDAGTSASVEEASSADAMRSLDGLLPASVDFALASPREQFHKQLISQIASSSPTHASPNTSTHDLSERADGAVLRPGMSGGALDMPSPSVVRRRSRRSSSLRREQRHNSGGHGAGDSSQQQQQQEQGQKEEGEGKGAEEDGRGDGEGKARGGREGEGEEQLVGKEERHWNDSDTRSDAESEHVSLASQRQEDGDSDDGDAVQVQTHVNGNGALLHCDSSSGDAAGRQGDAHFTPLVSPTKGIVLEAPSPL